MQILTATRGRELPVARWVDRATVHPLWGAPVLLAVLSSFRDQRLSTGLAAFGEVGLAGEIRPVPNGQARLHEAVKHGFHQAIIPAGNKPRRPPEGLEVAALPRLSQVLERISDQF